MYHAIDSIMVHIIQSRTRCFPVQMTVSVFPQMRLQISIKIFNSGYPHFLCCKYCTVFYRTVKREYKKRFLPPSLPGSGCEGDGGQCAACTRTTISIFLSNPLHIVPNCLLKPNRNARSRILGLVSCHEMEITKNKNPSASL
jgi:hypothetical protein